MVWYLSSKSKQNRRGVDQRLIAVNDRALEISPYDFGIPEHGGRRTATEQRKLYQKGVSKADGYHKLSDHQFGKALDFFGYKENTDHWDKHLLSVIACAHFKAAQELNVPLGWGGFWPNFKDYGHIYIIG